MKLTKKQVNSLLKVMYKGKDRAALECLAITRYGDDGDIVAVASNGYSLAALYLDVEEAEKIVTLKLRRDALETWYKLAQARDTLDTAGLVKLFDDDYQRHGSHLDVSYPDWTKLLDVANERPSEITFNAEYAKHLQDLDGSDGLKYRVNGYLKPMIAYNERGIYMLAPKVNTTTQ